jgi:pilus assembly protein FimV
VNNQTNSKLKKRVLAVAVASCLSFSPWLAQAAGLGKITVLSGLGQPLRAELEVSATREEVASMAVRLAPQDAFKQASIDYASVLGDLRFALEKRPDGKQVVKITSGKPLNEPFLDFLVELNWASGRLVREYTFLLDPPEVVVKSAGRPLSVVDAKVVQSIPGGTQAESLPVRSVPQANIKPAAPAATPTPPPAPVAPPPVREEKPAVVEKIVSEPVADFGPTRQTQSGDTLGKIANATKHEGVSLEQMLVGLYQNNPDAFIGKNLNRLKSGVILSIPDKESIEAIPEADAKKILLAQSGDWNAYRQKLASAAAQAPAKPDSASQQTAGKITAKVEEKTLPAEQGKDQVKVSRSEVAGKSAGKTGLSEEDQIARDRALKEAQERLLVLEKNVSELQKLLEMKNQKLAEFQQQTALKPAESKSAPIATVKEEAKESADKKPVEAAKPPAEEIKPVVAAKPVEAPKPPVKPLPEPEPEPGFVETLLADPLTMAGGAGVLALLLGYGLYKRRKDAAPDAATAAAASALGQSSVFRTSTGGQSVDTTNVPQTADFSQTGPGTIDTDEVDPVAEADVYMAYGRDAQAEEILIEALQKDPQRIAIHAKLLEIYAGRNSLKQFETLATELYAQTAGKGLEWDKVAALGATIDPTNPLYSGADAIARSLATDFDADATMVVTPERSTALKEEIAFELPQEATPASADLSVAPDFEATLVQEKPVAEVAAEESDELTGLDFDLGSDLAPEVVPPELIEATSPADEADDALDFDLGLAVPTEEAEPALDSEAIDFDLNLAAEAIDEVPLITESLDDDLLALDALEPPIAAAQVAAPAALPLEELPEALTEEVVDTADADDALEFDMRLTDSTVLGQTPAPSFDISSINLDLTQQAVHPEPVEYSPAAPPAALPEASAASEAAAANAPVDAAVREEINTKLDLAKAYEEMGDLEGARELLAEVAAEGPPDLAGEAKEILARIGS